MIRKNANLILALSALALGACSNESGPSVTAQAPTNSAAESADAMAAHLPAGLEILESRQVFEPQVTFLEDSTLVLTWRERGETGSNIYSSVRAPGGSFGSPVRVNDEADTVESYAHDGMRAAIAVGSGQTIAIAWTDSRAQIRAAISTNGGAGFDPSIRLDQSQEPAYRAYPAISFDSSGDLHAIWIDSRFAAGGAEEPADLYYAKVSAGDVTEKNLTAEQAPSICGCCRTFIRAEDDLLTMTFRNTTADNYRDPATISGTVDGVFSNPQAVAGPLWELRGCPMAGPIMAGDEVLWHDGSTGKKLIMVSSVSERQARPVFESEERGDWIGRRPPRPVTTIGGKNSLLLLPGQPASRLITRSDADWGTVADDLPPWAMSGAYENGQMYLVGAPGGEIRFVSYQFP